jgi:hypothetical protein
MEHLIIWFVNGPVLGRPVPAEIDHSKSGLVRYLDGHCSSSLFFSLLYVYQFHKN